MSTIVPTYSHTPPQMTFSFIDEYIRCCYNCYWIEIKLGPFRSQSLDMCKSMSSAPCHPNTYSHSIPHHSYSFPSIHFTSHYYTNSLLLLRTLFQIIKWNKKTMLFSRSKRDFFIHRRRKNFVEDTTFGYNEPWYTKRFITHELLWPVHHSLTLSTNVHVYI